MQDIKGTNIKDVKYHNRLLVLKYIAAKPLISRMDLAEATGLSKMAVGNMVNDLIEMGLVEETQQLSEVASYGRPPGVLRIAGSSPLICGMLIKRSVFQVILADLSGTIIDRQEKRYGNELKREDISRWLKEAYEILEDRQKRQVIAVGISSIGPADTGSGMILNPPFFYGISDVEIVKEISAATGLPTYLINDANAGALAEKLYGGAQKEKNFSYLHIMNGIGLGCVLDNKLYSGNTGQSGEIGHTSINCMGPRCECGNVGCLDLYANEESLKQRAVKLEETLGSKIPVKEGEELGWLAIVDAANRGNMAAVLALDDFCSYIAHAMTNIVNLLDFSRIIVGYDSGVQGNVVERLLYEKLYDRVLYSDYCKITVQHSAFGGDAPLIGAIAYCAEKIFDASLPILF